MYEWLRRWITAGDHLPAPRLADLDEVDERLTALEYEQIEIDARLRILEKQSNPRGVGLDD